ncbi:hypothetical protein HPB51_017311 [Rhipicephalus microplus]|uniref:PiggyBac transposable element-derived protein 4 C-terminal zinc-ribbon domain-containing protein n=1 Tax=Rhipicephalus microplus TaxID=6941 RepID=A0A9J6ETI3_RHIMP|nr:hypothetical protein HPB51_017311 [Rhipicephalus microplus]
MELVKQLLGIEATGFGSAHPPRESAHKPKVMETRRNCKLCYVSRKVEHTTSVFCETCGVYLCFIATRDCFGVAVAAADNNDCT